MKRFFASLACALRGFCAAVRRERHLRFHLIAATGVIIFGFVDGLADWEWVAITLCIGAVITAELFNSAIERLADVVTTEQHPGIAAAKDIAAAAVLVAAAASAVVGIIVFF